MSVSRHNTNVMNSTKKIEENELARNVQEFLSNLNNVSKANGSLQSLGSFDLRKPDHIVTIGSNEHPFSGHFQLLWKSQKEQFCSMLCPDLISTP